ncbi:unnamed protein product [Gulo gulo]|uniref:Uncharacterized protein n=1 Tax=Gulo gulo TaxID=48420 RepID=A0A9X9Q390_GULGU|nr:unnamed protein product [Gulo gulo]
MSSLLGGPQGRLRVARVSGGKAANVRGAHQRVGIRQPLSASALPALCSLGLCRTGA